MPQRHPRTGRRAGRPPARTPLVVRGAEAWSADPSTAPGAGPRVGVLVLHGFTGSPASVLPWARALADAGLGVAVPRLPGHGTDVRDLDRTTWRDWYSLARADLQQLRDRCDVTLVAGLSMGGALALRLAVHERGLVDGVAVVNPAVLLGDPRLVALPVLRLLRRTVPGVADDIAMPGRTELGYDAVPLRALTSFLALMADIRRDLPLVTQPTLVASSPQDHLIPPESARVVRSGLGSADVRDVRLERSFHVATLDHDFPVVVDETLRLVRDVVEGRASATPVAGVPA